MLRESLEKSALAEFSEKIRFQYDLKAHRPEDRIMVKFDIPAPANFILTDEVMAQYEMLYRMNLRLRLAIKTLDSLGAAQPSRAKAKGALGGIMGPVSCSTPLAVGEDSGNSEVSIFRLKYHLRIIIGELFSFVQSAVVMPELTEFKKKVTEVYYILKYRQKRRAAALFPKLFMMLNTNYLLYNTSIFLNLKKMNLIICELNLKILGHF